MLNVLIGGECSGIIRDAFRARGHNAWSCDLKPAEVPAPSGVSLGHIYHLTGDVLRVLGGSIPDDMVQFSTWRGGSKPIFIGWDLAIFHPDCTYLCNSGVKWLYKDGRKENGRDPERWHRMYDAASFFIKCYDAKIPRVAVENPIMHEHAYAAIGRGRAAQFIQPWQHGHKEMKATGLHLRNLPLLVPSKVVGPPPSDPVERRKWAKVHQASPGPNRSADRARTLPGIAAAMADQWGRL